MEKEKTVSKRLIFAGLAFIIAALITHNNT